VKLWELSKFCIHLNRKTEPDWIEEMHYLGKCRSDVTNISDLNEPELHRLERMQFDFRSEFLKEWPRTVLDGI